MNIPDFPVVGVGASAGGIEALEGFFRGLPAEPGLAIVIITHLSPDRESLLDQIVRRFTAMSVAIISSDVKLKPNCVYVLTRAASLTIRKRRLFLDLQTNGRVKKPVDIFFSSLAVDLGDRAAGVVLSGGDGDGTLGVKAIKERGGLTMAQIADGYGPSNAEMPDSAISTGFIDFAVPAEDMGKQLAHFAHSVTMVDKLVARSPLNEGEDIERSLDELYGFLRNQVGHDFSGYKTKTFIRRVMRRMQVNQVEAVDDYLQQLREEPTEVNALFRDLLINVTNFFRDVDAFEALAKLAIPKLFDKRGADDTVRIWVPGCSTGEEVYSLVILMREHMATLSAVPRVQVFATDIDERALLVARAARYPESLLDNVSEERRSRFFIYDGGSYVVSKDVRELCIFSPHSVIRDPPFSRIDLISCRNLLIYFGPDMQKQVFPTFHYALRPDGFLFLGSAENVTQHEELFSAIEKKHRIFKRRLDVVSNVRVPVIFNAIRPRNLNEIVPRKSPLGVLALRQLVDEHVLEHFSPAHVLVNRDGEIVYFSSKTGKYLEAPAGAPTRQMLTLARKGIRLDLRTVFREAVDSGRSASRGGVAVETENGVQLVHLTVEPLRDQSNEPLYLILFVDEGPELSAEEALIRARTAQDGMALHTERELRETRERLQSIIEEYETALEELKSSNEELVSVNEEMQSTNEELEASKEELQSVNEELHTVNAELSNKVEALARANDDLQNIFESTEVATVFLDKTLCIRGFTPSVARIFNILPSDRGRPITDLSSRISLEEFFGAIKDIASGGPLIERRVDSLDGKSNFLIRLSAYQDGSKTLQGVVMAFIDVTNITQAEARLRFMVGELQHRTRNLLTVVQSIARRTLGTSDKANAFAARLGALGRVQGVLSQSESDAVDIGRVIRTQLEAMGASASNKVSVAGPEVPLTLDMAQSFALVLHELGTNAMKYGALSDPSGALAISWSIQPNGDGKQDLSFDWEESGIPIPHPPERRGFGSDLIERAWGSNAGVKSKLTFGPDGLSCHLQMPVPSKG